MEWLRTSLCRVRALFYTCDLDRELDEELRCHVEFETEENIKRGMTPAEARRIALLEAKFACLEKQFS